MINAFRVLSFIEGISLLVLFFVAMPMKYLMGEPAMVTLVGTIHGGLFLAFVFMAILIAKLEKWPAKFLAFAVVTSSIPFGMFLLEKKLKSRVL